jgi:hypothetical protein
MLTDTARAIRDTSADILGQQTKALQSGYSEAAGLAGTDLSRMGTLATTAGDLASEQQRQRLAASGALAGLGAQAQELGLTGAGALNAIGTQQQQYGQKNLDVAVEDWTRQRNNPQEQINNMLNTFKGVQAGVPSYTREQGISPSGVSSKAAPGTAATIAGGLIGIAGILADDDTPTILKKLGLG